MNRRRVVFGGLLIGPLLIVAACTFPDVTFGPTLDGSAPDGSASEGSTPSDTGAPDSVSGDVVPPISDGSIPLDTSDASEIDAAGCGIGQGPPACDCDNDGYRDVDCGVPSDASLKPGDCDDNNSGRHPEAGPRQDVTANGDWNCDGFVTKYPPDGVTTCPSGTGTFGGLSCTAEAQVFYASGVGCGQSAELYACTGTITIGKCAAPTDQGKPSFETCQ